ncbi:MAG TPA: hypothetical protein PLQ11_01875 [Beijerinckiaceae bacterium]|nr:hypothetical protein [Beijerinckiaceae bacterium]
MHLASARRALALGLVLTLPAVAQDCMTMGAMTMCRNGFMSFGLGVPQPLPGGGFSMTLDQTAPGGTMMFHSFGLPPAGGTFVSTQAMVAPDGTRTQMTLRETANPDGSRSRRVETRVTASNGQVRETVEDWIIHPDGRACRVDAGKPACE